MLAATRARSVPALSREAHDQRTDQHTHCKSTPDTLPTPAGSTSSLSCRRRFFCFVFGFACAVWGSIGGFGRRYLHDGSHALADDQAVVLERVPDDLHSSDRVRTLGAWRRMLGAWRRMRRVQE